MSAQPVMIEGEGKITLTAQSIGSPITPKLDHHANQN